MTLSALNERWLMRNSVAALMITGAFIASGCNPILRTHGYVPTADAKPQEINPAATRKLVFLLLSEVPLLKAPLTRRSKLTLGITSIKFESVTRICAHKFKNRLSQRFHSMKTDRSRKSPSMASKIAALLIMRIARRQRVDVNFLCLSRFSEQLDVIQPIVSAGISKTFRAARVARARVSL